MTGATSNFVTHSLQTLTVSFTRYEVQAQGDKVLIQWETAKEENSRDFTVERSADGSSFTAIGTIGAAGNSTLPKTYSFTGNTPLPGRNYYRLKQSDLDGQFTYTGIRTVDFSTGDKLTWYRSGANAATVRLTGGSNEYYSLIDMNGRLLQQGRLAAGSVLLRRVSSGLYIVKVWTTTGVRQVKISLP